MTPRQFAVLQHLSTVGWDLPINISSRVFGNPLTKACARALSILTAEGLVEKASRKIMKRTKHGSMVTMVDLHGYQLTDAGEAALVAENLRLLREITYPPMPPSQAELSALFNQLKGT